MYVPSRVAWHRSTHVVQTLFETRIDARVRISLGATRCLGQLSPALPDARYPSLSLSPSRMKKLTFAQIGRDNRCCQTKVETERGQLRWKHRGKYPHLSLSLRPSYARTRTQSESLKRASRFPNPLPPVLSSEPDSLKENSTSRATDFSALFPRCCYTLEVVE